MMNKDSKILVLGGRGLVGSAIIRSLEDDGFSNISRPRSFELDLLNKQKTLLWFEVNRPEYVFLAAAKVGGIQANINTPVDFGIQNIEIINNVLSSAQITNVKKLLLLGSSCIYPAACEQPMKEEYLFSGPFEPTNEMYAISKSYGLRLCSAFRKQYGCNFIACQPCNIYGPGDNFNPQNSHVIAALIRKFYEAKRDNKKEVICWGDGMSRREIMYSQDLGDACKFLMNNYNEEQFLNVGTGVDMSIKELSEKIANIAGYNGNIIWDTSKPNGMRKKLLDITKIKNIGWEPKITSDVGLQLAYNWFKDNI
jgi:GDP-L-fucose synthase